MYSRASMDRIILLSEREDLLKLLKLFLVAAAAAQIHQTVTQIFPGCSMSV